MDFLSYLNIKTSNEIQMEGLNLVVIFSNLFSPYMLLKAISVEQDLISINRDESTLNTLSISPTPHV